MGRLAVTAAVALGAAGAVAAAGTARRDSRYLGYRDADRSQPWAHHFREDTAPVPDEVARAYAGRPVPPDLVPSPDRLVAELNAPGPAAIETGYGVGRDGTAWVACRTLMPGVTAEMWDWWFGWHSSVSSRYKLWHPEAHAFSDRSPAPPPGPVPPGRRGYVGMTSYVDEYVGPWLMQLAIRFTDPVAAGFRVGPGLTVVHARAGSTVLPLDLGILCHQVRPVPGGSEMRSRFHLNLPALRRPDLRRAAAAVLRGPLRWPPPPLPMGVGFARELLMHCGEEMNHLAGFLPALHREFRDLP